MSHIPTISIVLSSISATAAGTVLLSYASMKQRPKLADPSSMIVFLTLSDLALAIIGCFLSRTGPGFPDILCDSRSVCLIYFTFSSTLWTAAMSHSSSVMVKTLLRGKRVVNLSFRYQTLCWGMPLVIALLAHYFFQFGHVGGVDNRVCWFDLGGTWATVCCFLMIILPLVAIQGYNISILRYFGRQLASFPESATLLTRLSGTLFTVIMSKLLLVLALLMSTIYSLNGRTYSKDGAIIGHSSASWFVTVFIFIMPSIQGLIDCMVFFESKIVNRFKSHRSRDNNSNKDDINDRSRERRQAAGGLEPYRDRDTNDNEYDFNRSPSSKSVSRQAMFRERQSDFVFENFAVPVGIRYNRHGSEHGSDDMSGILSGSGGHSIDLSDEGAFNDVDLDSLDGNHSDDGRESNLTPFGGSSSSVTSDRHTISMLRDDSNLMTDIDDHGVEFRSLQASGKFTAERDKDHSTISEMLIEDDKERAQTPTTPMKKASEPIDLISF